MRFNFTFVFKGLVRDVNRDIDPHEGKEWFHANITKEQAYNLLSAGDYHPNQILEVH